MTSAKAASKKKRKSVKRSKDSVRLEIAKAMSAQNVPITYLYVGKNTPVNNDFTPSDCVDQYIAN